MFVEAEIWNVAHTDQGYAVLVKPSGHDAVIPIFVGQTEAQSILIGMGDIPMPRPNTHDLFLNGLSLTGCTVEKVEITEIKDGIYYSTVYLNNMSGSITLDSRPSDSLAIAVRAECPIYISEEVIEDSAVSLEFITEKTEDLNSDYEKRRINLEKELEKAVKLENYEEAAVIRDKLKKLDEEFF